jgi:hypothetical protein
MRESSVSDLLMDWGCKLFLVVVKSVGLCKKNARDI